MARHRALRHQFQHAIRESYRWRTPKNNFKNQWREIDNLYKQGKIDYDIWIKEKAKTWFIASSGDFFLGYKCKESYREELEKFAKNFGDWIQKTYGVKQVCDITPEMSQEFLNHKANEGVRATTLLKYVSMIKALALASYKTFNANLERPKYKFEFAKGIYVPHHAIDDELRTIKIEKEDYHKIINSSFYRDSKSTAKIAIPLARHFALRVTELARLTYGDIIIDYNEIPNKYRRFVVDKSPYNAYLLIRKSKGGVNRVIPALTKEEFELLKKIKEDGIKNGKNPDDWVIPVKKKAISTFLRRCFERCNLNQYIKHKVGIHGFRKLRASELFLEKLGHFYEEEKEKNIPEKQKIYNAIKSAGKYVDKYLGHETEPKSKKEKKQKTWRANLVKRYQVDVLKPEDIAMRLVQCGADYVSALQHVREILSELR